MKVEGEREILPLRQFPHKTSFIAIPAPFLCKSFMTYGVADQLWSFIWLFLFVLHATSQCGTYSLFWSNIANIWLFTKVKIEILTKLWRSNSMNLKQNLSFLSIFGKKMIDFDHFWSFTKVKFVILAKSSKRIENFKAKLAVFKDSWPEILASSTVCERGEKGAISGIFWRKSLHPFVEKYGLYQ